MNGGGPGGAFYRGSGGGVRWAWCAGAWWGAGAVQGDAAASWEVRDDGDFFYLPSPISDCLFATSAKPLVKTPPQPILSSFD